jgi:hypothetical protein
MMACRICKGEIRVERLEQAIELRNQQQPEQAAKILKELLG